MGHGRAAALVQIHQRHYKPSALSKTAHRRLFVWGRPCLLEEFSARPSKPPLLLWALDADRLHILEVETPGSHSIDGWVARPGVRCQVVRTPPSLIVSICLSQNPTMGAKQSSLAKAGIPTIYYWPIRGRAEIFRLALRLAGQEYKEVVPPSWKDDLNVFTFGQLPR